MGRLFWKFFHFLWLAQVVTSVGVGLAIWLSHPHRDWPPSPPPTYDHRLPPGVEQRPPPPMRGLVIPIVAGSLVSLVFAALLAWYFARPIRTLRTAFADVAAGRLQTRIGTTMEKRNDELSNLGGDFDRMTERLQSALEGQRRLFHDVSHELRSPLARLQAVADLMRQQPERASEFIVRIERDTTRMDRLVGELLMLARLDAGIAEAPQERIGLAELIGEITDDARLEAETRGCRISAALANGLAVGGNRSLLQRAIENVLRNALRHSPAGGEVAVALNVVGDAARISVADEGGGVAASDLDAIFEPFYRAADADVFAGYGLGLAITRQVMRVHGGTAEAQNRPDGGLVVTLSLPLVTRKIGSGEMNELPH